MDQGYARGTDSNEDVSSAGTGFCRGIFGEKRQRNLLDFSDMEQFALRILTEEKEGKLVPSAVAQEYQERFEEVMIDEYQDSNLVQETILTSVSRVGRTE